MLTITHTAAEGTLIEGTSRADGTNHILKACGWRWSRNLGAWYVPASRDRAPRRDLITTTTEQLRSAGHEVSVTIDDTTRTTAEIEADKIARQDTRADHLAAKARRLAGQADAAHEAARARADRVPFGQPILVGHHSERVMRRHYDQVRRDWDRSRELADAADEAASAARAAAATTGARYSVQTVANRIGKIEAEIRRIDRAITGHTRPIDGITIPAATGHHLHTLHTERDAALDQLSYWQQVRADQIATGKTSDYGPRTITPGDAVKISGHWYEVVRANPRTVTVTGLYTDGHTGTAPYAAIRDHRRASDTTT